MSQLQAILNYQEIDKRLYALERELAGCEERKEYVKAKKFLETAADKLDAYDAKAAQLKNEAVELTKKYLKTEDTLKDFSHLDELVEGGADIAFYKKNALSISDQLKKIRSELNALTANINATHDEYQKLKKQVIAMQNHMPYHDWYKNNDFKAESTTDTPLEDDEKESIETYQKGAALTDEATADFFDKLDAIDKPITVVFYGDHLPGIYSSASEDDNNSLALHLTDYFIWSNKASSSQGNEIDNADYSSPNFFVAQAAEHMNAKVSPYLAFLTQMHEKISAMEPPVVNNIQGWDRIPEGQNIYLDADGNPMAESDFDAETQQLLADYQLIQYDITTGKNYLKDTDFMDLP